MHRSTWKAGERRIASIFGSERTPLSGGNSKHTRSDSLHPRLFIESKHKTKVPGDRVWRTTLELAKKENKIPVVVYTKKNYPHPVIMCRLCDLKNIAAEIVDDKIEVEEKIEEEIIK